MEKFDAIVIGGGPAGSAAAFTMAKAGLGVLQVERGKFAGSKNVSGAIMYSRTLSDLIPDFWKEAPVERYITSHSLVFLTEKDSFALNFSSSEFGIPPYNSFSIHRAKFDKWFASKAEEVGTTLITGITVDDILKQDGKIIGIKAGSDELGADVVIAADGAKSIIAQKAGLRRDFTPKQVGIGIKEVLELPAKVIKERFNLSDNDGTAYTIIGNTNRVKGGGFLYTNKESISLGLVLNMQSIMTQSGRVHDQIETYKEHPLIARLIEGSEVVEYSAQIVHEGGLDYIPPLYADGFLVTGSAAGLVLNNAFTLRGIDLALASGVEAGRTVIKAKERNNFSRESLSYYGQLMKQSFVLRDLKTFRRTPHFLDNPRLYSTYPDVFALLFRKLYSTDREGKRLFKVARESMGEDLAYWHLIKDALEMLGAL